jgi:plasmid replication initiation protein
LLAGEIAVSLHRELFPYVRRLKERYTETELRYVFRLESSYSQKLYDLLKVRAFTGHAWKVKREELLELLEMRKRC